MLRITLLLITFCGFIFADSFKEDKNLEIISKNISMENNIITATGDVVAYSLKYYITADKLIYDKEKSTMEFFGNVTIVQDGQSRGFSEYLFIDTVNEMQSSNPLMLMEEKSAIWLNVKETKTTNETHELENTTFSSCDCIDPAWNLSFTSGDYNTQDKWLNTYNTTLYVKGVPVLYTPYFGFSTDKTRRSGILPPTMGYSSDEGLLYAQPFYYAPTIDFDLELIPQIRSNRGYGYETNLRYVDSQYSLLELEFGSFFEKQSYFEKEKLTNKDHNGWRVEYNRAKLFSHKDHSDGLKIDLTDMNDIDYQSTKYDDDISIASDKVITSMIKYYYNTNNYYSALEFKKTKDLSQENNDNILQTMPKVNLHKYLNSLLIDDLTYSVDVEYDKQTRKQGLSADITSITAPITYTNSFFDDYLEFSIGEELNLTQISYDKDNGNYKDGEYATLTHFAKVQTNLIKPYEDHIHTINLSATYKKPEEIQEKGDLYSITTNSRDLSIFPVVKSQERVEVSLNSSLYEKETLEQVVNYKISQLYTYNKINKSYKKDDLSQNIRLHFGNFTLSNDLAYSHDLKKIVLSSTTLDYSYKQAYFNTYYKYEKDKFTLDKEEELVYTIGFNFDNNYSLSYKEELDLNNDVVKSKEYIFGIDEKCWALRLKFADSLVPTDTVDNSVDRQHIVYLEFHMKELLNMQQKYKSN